MKTNKKEMFEMLKNGEIMVDIRVIFKVEKEAENCDTVEEAIEKGFIKHVSIETGSTRAEYGIAGRVDLEKVEQFTLGSLIKWER
jgi:hypothetical protein